MRARCTESSPVGLLPSQPGKLRVGKQFRGDDLMPLPPQPGSFDYLTFHTNRLEGGGGEQ